MPTLKKIRAKQARLYRDLGVSWAESHRISRMRSGVTTELFPNAEGVSSEWRYCPSCDREHLYEVLKGKHYLHHFCDGAYEYSSVD